MGIDIVRGELERLFSLEELFTLSSDLLGFPSADVGGTASKASFAKALVERSQESESLGALLDAMVASRSEIDARIREYARVGVETDVEIPGGATFGPFTIVRKLADGARGRVYVAKKDGADCLLKILAPGAATSSARLARFVTQVRLAAKVRHEGLPESSVAGTIDGRGYVAYTMAEGQPLSTRVARTGPLHLNEARPFVRAVLGALTALHTARLTHGGVKLENVIVTRGSGAGQQAVLVDAGVDRLGGALVRPTIARSLSPEQIRGAYPTAASDLYAFGGLLYELLSGKPPFGVARGADLVAAHVTTLPPLASTVAPKGWVAKEIDELLVKLLAKNPDVRPKSAMLLLELLEGMGRPTSRPPVASADFDATVDLLVGDPSNKDAAMALESSLASGQDATRVAEAFSVAADGLDLPEEGDERTKAIETKRALLYRAGRILENAKKKEQAEDVYKRICALDPTDDIAQTALEELRRELGKHDELIEMLLERAEKSESHTERARCFSQIGHLYTRELDDREQGVFAFAQALAQEIQNDEYASDLERAAASDMKLWGEALNTLSEASTHPRMPPEVKVTLFTRLGSWYSEKIARPDLGLACFQAVLAIDPANDGALAGMSQLYRRAQQWNELGQVVQRRADRAPTPVLARGYRAEAADILENKLNDAGRARDLYEQIVAEDPGHDAACDALTRIYQQLGDHEGLAKILERRAEALRGERRVEAICRVAELYEDQLNKLPEAFRRYELALTVDPLSLTALRGMDRILNRQGRYGELLDVLDKELMIAATPRQKINLLERMSGIYEEEFLDHAKAAQTLERVLSLDPARQGALSSLLRHYRALGQWEDVVTTYDRLLNFVTEGPARVEALLSTGRVLVEQIGSPQRAIKAYERVLEIDPNHGPALEALANVRVATGDASAALAAVEALAAKAEKPEQKSELWVRAAKLLDEKGDKDGAIERYKAALDALPSNTIAALALRQAYLARNDAASAVELIAREIATTEGKIGKARLYGEMASLLIDKLKDTVRGGEAATKAIDLDPTSLYGHLINGDLAYEAERFIESAKSYEVVCGRTESLSKAEGQRTVLRYIESLSKSGAIDKALATIDSLLKLAPDSFEAALASARVYLDAGQGKKAVALFEQVLERFDDKLSMKTRAETLLGLGTARFKAGDFDGAIAPLSEAADMDPESNAPIDTLSRVYEAKGDWEELVRVKTRRLDALSGEARTGVLLEIGDIFSQKLNDRTRASKSYVAALDERPDDRRVLTKLMQLYSEEKDWSRLVDVVLKLSSMVDDRKQKAKYLHTAAIVAGRQMGELERAAKFYDDVLELDPTLDKAIVEAIDVRDQLGDHEGVERLLKIQLDQASEVDDRDRMLATFDKLGKVYREKLGWTTEAIDAYEAAQTFDPDNSERNELLGNLYASDPSQFLDKAVAAQRPILRKNPLKPEPYRLLRKLYTDAKQADAAWCLCQALSCMNMAEPDEERFYRRMRADGAATAQARLTPEDWDELMHPDADPLVTAIFQMIEPAAFRRNGQALETLGFQPSYALDLVRHPYPMSQTIHYACGVFGMEAPMTFQNPDDPGGLAFLHAYSPAIVLGTAALAHELPGQPAAFIAARHLTYYRPGLYIRHLVPTGTGLRAWLFAAIRLVVPAFPVTPELEGPVAENIALLESSIVGPRRDQLASLVTKLLQSGAIDLKKWVAGVDLTADRAALLLAHDLEVSLEMVRASDEAAAAVTHRDRTKELLLYSVSSEYFGVRTKLGITIDA